MLPDPLSLSEIHSSVLTCLQAADFLFGTAALPHDFLHEPLLRILATGFAGASTAAASLNVSACHLQLICRVVSSGVLLNLILW